MSRIQGKETKLEIKVRQFLRRQGIGFRKNYAHLPGKPDVVLTKYKSVIFINGCFWHGHEGCKYYVVPKTRTEWWMEKIAVTKERDTRHTAALVKNGWRVFVIWECELEKAFENVMNDLILKLKIRD